MPTKSHKKIIWVIIIVIFSMASIVYYFSTRSTDSIYDTVIAQRNDIYQKVNVNGIVSPVDSVKLAMEVSGKISDVLVDIGDVVLEGQELVRLSQADIAADVEEFLANLDESRAKLDQYQAVIDREIAKLHELEAGTRPEEIKIAAAKVIKSKASLLEAQKNYIDVARDAYTKADDGLYTKIDQFINNPHSNDPQVKFTVNDDQVERDFEAGRLNVGFNVANWKTIVATITTSSDLTSFAIEVDRFSALVLEFAGLAAAVLNEASPFASITQATLNGYKDDVAAVRSSMLTARSSLTAANEKLTLATADLTVTENELSLLEAGTVSSQLEYQRAQVAQAQADYNAQLARVRQSAARAQSVNADLAKYTMRSPIDGIITLQDAKVGEFLNAGTPLISIISESQFELTVDVPESDINTLGLGMIADITLDAFSHDRHFSGTVSFIEPSERLIQDVVYYRVTVVFDDEHDEVKSGMTADVTIMTAQSKDVITLPIRAVAIAPDGSKSVRILVAGKAVMSEVMTGIRGDDGTIEILSGVSEGDYVIIGERSGK